MQFTTTQQEAIQSLLSNPLESLWDACDADLELFKAVLNHLASSHLTAADFNHFCTDYADAKELISTLQQLRRIAFPLDSDLSWFEKLTYTKNLNLFHLKSAYFQQVSQTVYDLEQGTSPWFGDDYVPSEPAKVDECTRFTQTFSADYQGVVKYKEHQLDDLHSEMTQLNERANSNLDFGTAADLFQRSPAQYLRELVKNFGNAQELKKIEIQKIIRQLIQQMSDNDIDIDLSKLNLSGLDLSQLSLTSADFSKATLTDTNLTSTLLGEAIFRHSDLRRAQIDENTTLDDVVFEHAKMDREVLEQLLDRARGEDKEFDLKFIDVRDQDLTHLNLSGIYFNGANFSRANLTGARVNDCDFTDAKLWNVKGFESFERNRVFSLKGTCYADESIENRRQKKAKRKHNKLTLHSENTKPLTEFFALKKSKSQASPSNSPSPQP